MKNTRYRNTPAHLFHVSVIVDHIANHDSTQRNKQSQAKTDGYSPKEHIELDWDKSALLNEEKENLIDFPIWLSSNKILR